MANYTFIYFFFLDVIVRFAEAEYSINENGNSQEVCTELSGRTQIPVSISLVTLDGSASSKLAVDALTHTCMY